MEYVSREEVLKNPCSYLLPNGRNSPKFVFVDHIKKIPAADVAQVVRCKDCIYWQKPQVLLNDGTYRDYEPSECDGFVSLEVGINVGSYCTRFDRDNENRIPHYMNADDFCSRGARLE